MTGDFKPRFDGVLRAFLDRQRPGAERVGGAAIALLEAVCEFTLRGGKRTRPWLTCLAYTGLGGAETARAEIAACSIELMQTFLLIHDDVIDRSDRRRGAATVHRRFEASAGDAHAGVSMAILAGDLACGLGAEAIRDAGFDAQRTARALALYHAVVIDECYGQATDTAGVQTSAEVLRVFHYKTTRYTIEGPLHTGAILAGAGDETLEGLSEFAEPLGAAFQLRDDILDLYGDPATTGKPVGTDVLEGKRTLLALDAIEHAPEAQAALDAGDVPRMQALVRETGALARAELRVAEWLDAACVALPRCGLADAEGRQLQVLARKLAVRDQ